MVKNGHSKIFYFLRHFLIILKRDFFRASILHHITNTGIREGPCFSDLTLLNDPFNEDVYIWCDCETVSLFLLCS